MTIDDGKHAARLAALQMMASLKAACNDDLDNVIIPYRLAIGDKKDIKQMWDIKNEEWRYFSSSKWRCSVEFNNWFK